MLLLLLKQMPQKINSKKEQYIKKQKKKTKQKQKKQKQSVLVLVKTSL